MDTSQRAEHGAETVLVRYWAGARAAAGVDEERLAGPHHGRRPRLAARRPPTRRWRPCCPSARCSSRAGRALATTRSRRVRSSRSSLPSPADDGRMPRVDDQPTDVTPEAGARRAARARAARRARRDAVLRTPCCPALATVRRPFAVAATMVLAALLVLALLADPVLLAAGLAWAGIVVAWGWPALHGSSSRFGSSLAIGVAGGAGPCRGGRCAPTSPTCASCPSRSSSASP